MPGAGAVSNQNIWTQLLTSDAADQGPLTLVSGGGSALASLQSPDNSIATSNLVSIKEELEGGRNYFGH